MKTEIYVNGVETEIELTESQAESIAKAYAKIKSDKRPIMERITSLQSALDYNNKTLTQFEWETERDDDQQKATKELQEIAKALREGKELGMGAKWYYPYFRKPVAGSGSGFSFYDYIFGLAYSFVGAPLCVDTAEKAIYMGKQFPSIYSRHLSPKQSAS